MQSCRNALLEAAANVRAGLALSFIQQRVRFRILGILATICQRLVMTAAFTAQSLARNDVLRHLFSKLPGDHRRAQDAEPEGVRS